MNRISLRSPRFGAFLIAQFLGAMNDNAFKMTLVLFALATIPDLRGQVRYSSLATALYPIPFLLFSPLAGYLADRFSKHRVLLWSKCPEIPVMALGAIGFYLGSLPFLLMVLFLGATHSTFFSPAKYGILPEVVEDQALSFANGLLEMTTDLAILIGSLAGVYVYSAFSGRLAMAGFTYFAIACLGTIAVLFVPGAPAGNPAARFVWNAFDSFAEDLAEARRLPALYYSILGVAYYGLLGSFFLTIVPVFGKSVLRLDEGHVGLLLAVLSVGVGLGSLIAGRLSRKHVELGLVPLGSIAISILALALSRAGAGSSRTLAGIPAAVAIELALLGMASGLFIVPLNSTVQQRSPEGMKGRLVAFTNVLTFGAVLVAAGLPWLLTDVLHLAIGQAILAIAILTIAGTFYAVTMLPDFLVRLLIWILTNTIYRIRVVGEENIPRRGALFVSNHVSWVDALLIAGACDRMVRFLMFRAYYEWKPVHWFFRMMHAIPVAAHDASEKVAQSLALAQEEIRRGHAVCIFAEGAITRTGNLLRFKRGFERIAGGIESPIIPIYLDGVWGSIFSYERGRFLFKWPRRPLAPITVVFGPPLPPSAGAAEVRQAIQDLSARAFRERKAAQRPIHVAFMQRARRRWRSTLMVDPNGARLRFGQALVRSLVLSRTLFGFDRPAGARPEGERVGILLPAGSSAVLANFAAWFGGRVPVNLDATAPGAIARSMIAGAQIESVVTSRDYLARLGFAERLAPAKIVFIEDKLAALPALRVLLTALMCRAMPPRLIARLLVPGDCADVDRVATVLYSYPEDAPDNPSGAMLTHHNLLSNLESLRQVFRVTRDDCILGMIPFSNAMSFTGTLLIPAIAGARVVYAGDMADRGEAGWQQIGELCRRERVSLIPASPELAAKLLQFVSREQLERIRHVMIGGGALSSEDREAFERKFGVEPLEGYGCPECAPIVALNVPDHGRGKEHQIGARVGSHGHPLPGISVRIVDPASGMPVPQGGEGMLLVAGANVMKGYIGDPEASRRVLVDGWYVTGDLATIDQDGFLTIRGRFGYKQRFSSLGPSSAAP